MSVNVYDPVNDTLIPVAGATLYADTPIGAIQAFDAEEVPDGWLIFNGQTVLRSDYPDLWSRANRNGQVGEGKFYGIGDGSTTFTLADLRETSLKGYGETSRSVGNHVKSGGLAVGEFIDDQLQDHKHPIRNSQQSVSLHINESNQTGGYAGVNYQGVSSDSGNLETVGIENARVGSTTEVKAVGVVWAVKAKQVGLPINLKEQVRKQMFPDYAHPITIPSGTTTWTATEDCYILQMYFTNVSVEASMERRITIDGNIVGIADAPASTTSMSMFSGYVKKGQVVSTVGRVLNLNNSQTVKIFPLTA
jgi:microcystin-dependent protein